MRLICVEIMMELCMWACKGLGGRSVVMGGKGMGMIYGSEFGILLGNMEDSRIFDERSGRR